jgi:hypothetical protein
MFTRNCYLQDGENLCVMMTSTHKLCQNLLVLQQSTDDSRCKVFLGSQNYLYCDTSKILQVKTETTKSMPLVQKMLNFDYNE